MKIRVLSVACLLLGVQTAWAGPAGTPASAAPDTRARLELAQALAGSGRYPESMRHYRDLYNENPDDPEVLGGMAEVLARSGRKAEALNLYKRALRLNPGDSRLVAARQELEMEAFERIHSEGIYRDDSDGQRASRSRIWFDGGEARSRAILFSVFREEMVVSPGPRSNRDRQWGATLGGSALLLPGWTGRAEAGASKSEGITPRTWVETSLSARSLTGFTLSALYSFRDRGYELRSFAARHSGITGHEGILTGSFQTGGGGILARLRGGSLSDGNRYRAGEAAWDQILFRDSPFALFPQARVVAGVSGIDYDRGSELYYAASKEWSATAGILATIWRFSRVDIAGGLRAGRTANDLARGAVVNGGVRAGVRIDRYSSFQAGFVYDQGVRSSTYISRLYHAGFQWGH